MMTTRDAPHNHEDEQGGTHGHKDKWGHDTATMTSRRAPMMIRTSREAPHGHDMATTMTRGHQWLSRATQGPVGRAPMATRVSRAPHGHDDDQGCTT